MNYFNYFTEIEETFVRRRGKHLLLSTVDWALIESWKEKGIPLYVALRGIECAFDSYEARPRRRSVKSLFYCQEEVEAQYAEWLESQLGASATTPEEQAAEDGSGALPFPREVIAEHLARNRDALKNLSQERAKNRADELCQTLRRAASRLEEMRKDFAQAARPDAQQIEDGLTQLEEMLDRAIQTSLPREAILQAQTSAEAQLRPYKKGMNNQIYEQTLANLMAKALRECTGVPRLSLFYL